MPIPKRLPAHWRAAQSRRMKEEWANGIFKGSKDGNNHKVVVAYRHGLRFCSFYCVREAERQLGISHGNISHVLSGRFKHCKGFSFKYENVS